MSMWLSEKFIPLKTIPSKITRTVILQNTSGRMLLKKKVSEFR